MRAKMRASRREEKMQKTGAKNELTKVTKEVSYVQKMFKFFC